MFNLVIEGGNALGAAVGISDGLDLAISLYT